MSTYILLLRGINVGGHNKLSMPRLRGILETLGCTDIKSYIQSGNLVFHYSADRMGELEMQLGKELLHQFGFRPECLFISKKVFIEMIESSPYLELPNLDQRLHVGFLARVPEGPNIEKMESIKGFTESFTIKGKVFYLDAPDGIGRSKLAAQAEKWIGVPMTMRNWRTVKSIQSMLFPESSGH